MTKTRTKREPDQWDTLLDQLDLQGLTQVIPKYQKRVPLFNDQIISMYAFGMTNRDIHRERSSRAT
jgi:hypothetical protein